MPPLANRWEKFIAMSLPACFGAWSGASRAFCFWGCAGCSWDKGPRIRKALPPGTKRARLNLLPFAQENATNRFFLSLASVTIQARVLHRTGLPVKLQLKGAFCVLPSSDVDTSD